MKFRSLSLILLFQLVAAPAFAEMKDVVFALKPNKNPEKMLSEKNKLEQQLSQLLKRKVKVIIPISSAVIVQGMSNGTIDLGYLSSVDMVTANQAGAANVLLAGEIKGRQYYESVWLTKKDRKYQSIGDLKGKPIAFSSRTSTSGYLIPYWQLIKSKKVSAKQDPAAFFGQGNVWYGTGYVTAVKRVLSGQAEAAAVSDYVFFGNKHLSAKEKASLRVLQKQGPVPTHMIAVRKGISAKDQETLRKALLELNKNTTLRDQVFTAKLVEVDPKKHLSSTREALQLTGFAKKR